MTIETAAGIAAGATAAKAVDAIDPSPESVILADILDQLVRQNDYTDRQRRRTRIPYDLSIITGTTTGEGNIRRFDTFRRGSHLLVSGGTAGDEYALYLGQSQILRFVMGSTGVVEIDCPLMFGTSDVQLKNLTTLDDSVPWRAYLWVDDDRDDISHRKS